MDVSVPGTARLTTHCGAAGTTRQHSSAIWRVVEKGRHGATLARADRSQSSVEADWVRVYGVKGRWDRASRSHDTHL